MAAHLVSGRLGPREPAGQHLFEEVAARRGPERDIHRFCVRILGVVGSLDPSEDRVVQRKCGRRDVSVCIGRERAGQAGFQVERWLIESRLGVER